MKNKNSMTIVQVWSDNFDGEFMTKDAYEELRLIMSTGDYCTHKHRTLKKTDQTNILNINDVLLG